MGSRQILGSELVAGQPVAYDGPDVVEAVHGTQPPLDALRAGHPGRIRDGTPQHIMVDWVGLEDQPISFASGFVNERRHNSDDTGSVSGLLLLTEDEYERRAAVIRAGGAPSVDG